MHYLWIVLNADGTYAGTPCETWEEARELTNAQAGRKAYILDTVLYEVSEETGWN